MKATRLGAHRLDRHPDVLLDDPVEALRELPDRVEPAGAHGLADRRDRRYRRLDVEVGARDGGAVVDGPGAVGAGTTEVDATDHAPILRGNEMADELAAGAGRTAGRGAPAHPLGSGT